MLEIMTYRFRGHSMGDPERYRKQEEVKKWEEHDPIGIFHAYLIANKKATAKVTRSRSMSVRWLTFRKRSSLPKPARNRRLNTLFDNVYAEEV